MQFKENKNRRAFSLVQRYQKKGIDYRRLLRKKSLFSIKKHLAISRGTFHQLFSAKKTCKSLPFFAERKLFLDKMNVMSSKL